MLQSKLNLISGRPVSETKANINAVAYILRDERYDKKVKDFVDYINSLYGPETVEKIEKILNDLLKALTFNTKHVHVSPPTTNLYIPADVTPVPSTEDKESSNNLEEATSVEARANRNEKVEDTDTNTELEDVLDSSSNSIEKFQEKLREFNTQRYVTLVTEGFDEVHSEDETDEANQIGTDNGAKHKNKPQTSGGNSKYLEDLDYHETASKRLAVSWT